MENIEELANAVIVQAVRDYRDESLWLNAHKPVFPEDEENDAYRKHLAEKNSIEKFFLSGWFSLLSDLNGKVLLEKLRKECAA